MLAGATDKTVVDVLLAYLETPGPRNVNLIITALGESKDIRALPPLSRIAGDYALRRGSEAELGAALAMLGDPASADLIADMIKRMNPRHPAYELLLESYKKLTKKDYGQD